MFSSLWHYLMTIAARTPARRWNGGARTARPRLEMLEDRLSPALHVWTGAVSNLWSNAGNWTGGSPAGDSLAVVSFPTGAANLVNQNDIAGVKLNRLHLNGAGYTISGNAVTVNDGALIIVSSPGSHTFNPNITLAGGDVEVRVTGGASVALGGNIAGAAQLTKTLDGTLILSGTNTYTGNTSVGQGVLNIRSAKALGTANNTFVADAATLEIQGGITVAGETLQLGSIDTEGAGVTATLRNVGSNTSGTNTWAGPVRLNSNVAIDLVGTTTLVVSGVIQGAGDPEFGSGQVLTKSGTGTLEFTAVNTYPAFTEVAVGTLRLRPGGRLGSTEAGTRVVAGATLALQDSLVNGESFTVHVGNEALELNGTGVVNGFGNSGALRNVSGSNSWAGPVTLASTAHVAVIQDGLDLRGTVGGSGGLTMIGPALLSYTGVASNTYTGITRVSGGTLLVNKTLTASGAIVTNQAVLGGNGTIRGVALQGGVLSPGSAGLSAAILRTQGNVVMDHSSSFDVSVSSAAPGTFDQLLITGSAELGNATLHVSGNGGAVNDTFVILQASAGLTGTFNSLPNNAEFFLANGVKMRINYTRAQVILTHLDTAPALQNRQVTTPIDEGQSATVTGRITEPDTRDTFFLEVNWGDGTPTQTYRFLPGTPRDIAVSHRYHDDRPSGTPADVYTIDLFWHDQHGLGNRGTLAVTVRNVDPVVLAGGDATVREDKLFQRSVSFIDPGRDRWTATVDYGDGSGPQTLRLGHDKDFKLRHRYTAPGTYHVVVTVRDDDGGIGTVSFDVLVRA